MIERHRITWVGLALVLVGTACPTTSDPEGDSSTQGSGGSDSSDSSGASGSVGGNDASSGGTTGNGTSSGGSSEDAADTSGGTLDPACDCVAGAADFVDFLCEVDEQCEPVEIQCAAPMPQDCALEDFVVVDPTVLPCVHDALVAGTPGLLRWEAPYYPDPGVAGQRQMLVVQQDRRAINWQESWGTPSYDITNVEVIELRSPEHFDGCMVLGSPEEQFRCLFDVVESSVDVCIEAHSFEIG